jgi:hypothetical protein
MIGYLVGSIAGRIAVALCAVTILLPYVLRRGRVSRGLARAPATYVQRLWPHFWLGYGIVALSILHAGTVGGMGRANRGGIWAATVALFLLVFEVVVGLSLKEELLSSRQAWRRAHFWVMAVIVASLGLHLLWNG